MFTRVNLYKNCILTARNTEVFRTAELLETYLGTLDKPYTADIDIANVYTTLSGDITIDATPLNGDFNYIKFQEFDDNNQVKQTVYAFIDSFRIVNDLLVISYSTDIWHTYIGKWTLRDSVVGRSLWRFATDYTANLPVSPLFNGNKYDISRETIPNSGIPKTDVCIIAKLQFFKLSSGIPDRSTFTEQYYLIENINLSLVNNIIRYDTPTKAIFTTEGLNGLSFATNLEKLFQNQNANIWLTAKHNDSTGDYIDPTDAKYCNIVKLYILPEYWVAKRSNYFDFQFIPNGHSFVMLDTPAQAEGKQFFAFSQLAKTNTDFEIYTKLINKDINNISIGFYTSLFKYDYIGRDTRISILASINPDEFSLYLCYNGTKTEITALFEFIQDYSVISAETVAQREIARKLDTVSGITGTIQGIAQVAIGATTMGMGLPSIPYTTANSELDVFGIPIPSQRLTSPEKVAHGGGGIVGGISTAVNSIAKMWSANADKYAPIQSQHNYEMAIVNAQYGFIILRSTSTSMINRIEVEKALRNIGYTVRYIVNTIDLSNISQEITHRLIDLESNNIDDYNIIQFDFVRLTGLSTKICEMIAAILMNGVKIWYTANV